MNERKRQARAFREWYSHLGEIRALVEHDVPFLCLTATASESTQRKISKILCLKNPAIIKANPDRPNIKYVIERTSEKPEETFFWLIELLREKGKMTPKTIIYCRSLKECGLLYDAFRTALPGASSYASPELPMTFRHRLYAMYHRSTDCEIKYFVASSLAALDSVCRIVFATVALGMGLDFPDVRYIINYGPPNTIDQYSQQCGRAGRDGKFSTAFLLWHSRQLRTASAEMKRYLHNTSECRRKLLLKEFGWELPKSYTLPHFCCDVCAKYCNCGQEDCQKATPIMKSKKLFCFLVR